MTFNPPSHSSRHRVESVLRRGHQLNIITFVCMSIGSLMPALLYAQPPEQSPELQSETHRIREYRSSRLLVRTDLPESEATALYQRLENTLGLAAQYWGRKSKGQIECFVVDDLEAWTDRQLPHRLSRVIINGVGGATIPRIIGSGKHAKNLPTVYASSRRGVAEHELVHAYCIHTFGSSGPEWYKEGMAEMVVKGGTRESGMQCSPEQIAILHSGRNTSLATIFECGATGKKIFTSLNRMMNNPDTQSAHVTMAEWSQVDIDNVQLARHEYLHSWAFCYMMLHNPNYAKRFRSLGGTFITEQREAFDEFFGPVRDHIEFEHQQLLENASIGYRADLCAWDWSHRFKKLKVGQSKKVSVVANKGFQPSGVTVVAGQSYAYVASGEWSLSQNGGSINADGNEAQVGRLIGVVMADHRLSEPISLGAEGSWKATASGKLYLRCQDSWNEIADNSGQVIVTITAM